MTSTWQLAYHLSGLTLLARTGQEPLGALPVPLRSAVVTLADQLVPDELDVEQARLRLLFADAEYSWVRRWRFRRELVADTVLNESSIDRRVYGSLDDYIAVHELSPRGDDDEHFAEREFLRKAFVPVYGLGGLSYLEPQFAFQDSDGKQRRIDFLLDTGTTYALEVEGRRYHSSSLQDAERFDDEKARQRELALRQYRYVPFSYNDIRNGRAKSRIRDLADEDPILAQLRENPKQQPVSAQGLGVLTQLLQQLPAQFPEVQKAVLTILAESSGQTQVTLVDHEPDWPLLPLAVADTLSLIERVAELYDCPVSLPHVHIRAVRPSHPGQYHQLLQAYAPWHRAFPDAPRTPIHLEVLTAPAQAAEGHHVFALARTDRSTPAGALTQKRLPRFTAPFLAKVSPPPQDARPVHVERHLLDYFARRYFTLPEVKPEQIHLVQRALLSQSGLGILPTGFGKSLVFQLYALMVPQTMLVISPLKALIRDQVHAMRRLGLHCVDAITGADSAAVKDRKMADFRARKLRLLYISPERLQIKAFYEELQNTMAVTPVGAIVVDEAHCVSEWGHDFRPAYLQIGHLRARLSQASGREIPLLAMTATASELVRNDIRAVLDLTEDSVVQLSSSDRPTLSLSVHPVASTEKAAHLQTLLQKTLPEVLKIPAEQLLPHGAPPPYPHAGVVFAVYANPHGRGTLPEGVHAIAKVVNDHITFDPDLVRVHASTAPTVCPKCRSPLWVPMSKAEMKQASEERPQSKRCLNCDAVFQRPTGISSWDKTIAENQDAFQNNDFPILVATKGYGMGIDKQNLRFIVHHALSSGLEGYYQEAGRAGRDGRHAHVALLYAPPVTECQVGLKGNPAPPCVTERRNFMFHRCPHGLETLCDYGKQARFIHSSYAGVDEDVQDVLNVMETLTRGEAIETDERSSEDESKDTQLALYRLQQLGIVRGYSLKYKSLTRIEFTVDFNAEWQPADVTQRLKELLMKFGLSSTQAERQVAELTPTSTKSRRRRVTPPVETSDFLAATVKVLLNRVYDTVPVMRYDMLRNELDYANATGCRRVILRARFDTAPPSDDYTCGFCDTCVPDLKFTRTEAAIPARDAQVEEVARMLPELMQAFNRDDLTTVIQTSVTRGAVTGMYARVASRLESDATNLAALYLGGALARRRPDHQQEALQLLTRGFKEGEKQSLPLPDLLDFSREASHIQPDTAFHLLTPVQGPFNTDEGLALVEEQAEQLFGTHATETRTVRAVRKTRTLARTADKVVESLQRPVDDLLQGFADLDDLLKEAS